MGKSWIRSWQVCNIYQILGGKLISNIITENMAATEKIREIQKLMSRFPDDKVAISLIVSDKFKGYRVCGHKSLSDFVTSKLSTSSKSSASPSWNMNDSKYSDTVIYPYLSKPFEKLSRDEMRQLLSVIIRAEQNRFGRK